MDNLATILGEILKEYNHTGKLSEETIQEANEAIHVYYESPIRVFLKKVYGNEYVGKWINENKLMNNIVSISILDPWVTFVWYKSENEIKK